MVSADLKGHKATQERMEGMAHQDRWDHLACPANLATMESLDLMERWASQVCKESVASPARMDLQASTVSQDTMARMEKSGPLVWVVSLAKMELLVPLVLAVSQVTVVQMASPDRRVCKAFLASQDHQESMAIMASLVLMVNLA